MSAEALITSMKKLHMLHKSLYKLAVEKTDIIKSGDMDALNQMLKDEQTHIAAIEQMEKERQKAAKAIAPNKENPSVSDCIGLLIAPDQDKLSAITNDLADAVYELKEQNYLNQQLIHHSLQFVNVSMNLLRPQPQTINYGPPAKNKKPSTVGMFNSKA